MVADLSSFRLAVLVEGIGAPSETFIRNHLELLAPGQTLAIARSEDYKGRGSWETSAPVVLRRRPSPRLRHKVLGRLVRAAKGRESEQDYRSSRSKLTIGHDLGDLLSGYGVTVVLAEYLDKWVDNVSEICSAGLRVFGHAHGYDVSRQLRDARWRERYQQWRRADGIIVPAQRPRERLIDLGLDPARVHVIPYGVSVPERTRKRLPGPQALIKCLAVGRMVPKKAPLNTLRAFQLAREASQGTLQLTFVGAGPLFDAAVTYVHENGLAESVSLLGAQPNASVQDLMRHSDIFLQHSMTDAETGDEEGLPVAILEAMASGLPVVSTRHAGIPEAVMDGVNGYLVEEGNVEGMAQSIVELAADPHLRAAMGEAGWRLSRESFSVERQSQLLRALLGLA